MPWRKNDLEKLEVIHDKIERIALVANKYVAVKAIQGDVGWSTFEEKRLWRLC